MTTQEKIIVKGSLKTVAQQFSEKKKMLRVHKSYLVAEDKIILIKGGRIIIDDHTIPIGRLYKKSLETFISR